MVVKYNLDDVADAAEDDIPEAMLGDFDQDRNGEVQLTLWEGDDDAGSV